MIREIVHDPMFLSMPSKKAEMTEKDLKTAVDLLDTLQANSDRCVGMAANMIGERSRIICFDNGGTYMTMLNPEILKASGAYNAKEGCLSFLGEPREVKRYRSIKVRYQTASGEIRIKTFEGQSAQIIQHEVDHCNGVLI